MNPAILDTIKNAWFSKKNGTGKPFIPQFPVVGGKRHIPIPLIALAATAVRCLLLSSFDVLKASVHKQQIYFGLYQYKTGSHIQVDFDGNTFSPRYRAHKAALEKLEKESKKTYARVMLAIFDYAAYAFY